MKEKKNARDNIVARLKKELKNNNITQKELANKLKISEPSFSRILNRQKNISLNCAIKIAEYFEIGLDELIGEKQ